MRAQLCGRASKARLERQIKAQRSVAAKLSRFMDESVAQRLLDKARLSHDQVAGRCRLAVDPSYWLKLNPAFSVDGADGRAALEASPIQDREMDKVRDQFAEGGHFRTGPVLTDATIRRLRECIERLLAEDWPPAFALVYDEFWMVRRLPAISRLLSALMGSGYRQMMGWIWVHSVSNQKGASGWSPHCDSPGRPNRLTLWIPLSDATLDNGCMYVVPNNLRSQKIVDHFVAAAANPTMNLVDVLALLQNSMALPARGGSLLGWGSDVIHWGGRCVGASEPRLALSQHFVGPGQKPKSDEVPLIDEDAGLPSFGQRLKVIGDAIVNYQRFEPLLIKYVALAQRLKEWASSTAE
jgi:Phytanoyl-CoA dioxygenase (PhyH)